MSRVIDRRPMHLLRRLARAPATRFLMIGVLLFTVERWWVERQEKARDLRDSREIVIERERLDQIQQEFQDRYGSRPTSTEEAALLRQEIREEILYREALARGLDRADRSIQGWLVTKMRFVAEDPEADPDELYQQALELGLAENDTVIRRILIQKMRLLAEQAEGAPEVGEDELQAYFEANGAEWAKPPRTSLHHVFLSRDRRGAQTEADAAAILTDIANRGPRAGTNRGDPFALGRRHRARSQQQLQKLFGPEFARSVNELPIRQWTGPVSSAYGLHLVYIDERLPGEDANLPEVRNQVVLRRDAERRAAVLERQLKKMEETYRVRVEPQAPPQGDDVAS